jgi:hypothetical protein
VPVFSSSEKRQLEPDAVPFLAGVAVLLFLGRVLPPIRRQQRRDSGVVVQPRAQVEVVSLAGRPLRPGVPAGGEPRDS